MTKRDDAIESNSSGDPVNGHIDFTLNGNPERAVTLPILLSGDAAINTAVEGDQYRPLSSGITFQPNGSTTQTLDIIPLQNNKAEGDKVVGVILGAGKVDVVGTPHAEVSIGDTDTGVAIKLGDDSADQILQGSADGTQNLVPLEMDFPKSESSGAFVTLSENSTTHANI